MQELFKVGLISFSASERTGKGGEYSRKYSMFTNGRSKNNIEQIPSPPQPSYLLPTDMDYPGMEGGFETHSLPAVYKCIVCGHYKLSFDNV